MKLIDFKLEYGRLLPDKTEIVLADEISPGHLPPSGSGSKTAKMIRIDSARSRPSHGEVCRSPEIRVENAIGSRRKI
jgi:hypothetical protein